MHLIQDQGSGSIIGTMAILFLGLFDSTIFFNVSILKSVSNIKYVLFKCVSVGGQWEAMNINCPIGFIGHVVALPDRAMSPRPAMDWNGLDAPAAFLINTCIQYSNVDEEISETKGGVAMPGASKILAFPRLA